MTASSILRKLGNSSRKNKLYFAFRELERVVRTEFLLRYIDDYGIDQDFIKDFAPYRTGHINRFGNHILDVDKTILPLDEEKDFKLKMKVRLKPE